LKEFFKVWFPILLLIIGLFWITSKFIKPPPSKTLTIATGDKNGVYFEYAKRYKKLLQEYGVSLKIIESAGSYESLELLKKGKVDIGFVQGGVASKDASNSLESIASIYFEPLWLFKKKSYKKIEYISELQNLHISIGSKGSGTNLLVSKIFEANELTFSNDKIKYLNFTDSYKALKELKIDAFFSVLSASSPMILDILKDTNFQAISLKRVKAYEEKFPYLHSIKIPEGGISLKDNIPKSNITLLATTANLLVSKNVDDTLVRLFAKIVKIENDRNDGFPSTNYLELPINEQAKSYLLKGDSFLEKNFPYWIASNIDRFKIMLIPILTLLLPLFKGFFPIYRWRIRSKIYRWYKELDKHEKMWEKHNSQDLTNSISDMKDLQNEIRNQVNVPLSYKNEYYMLKTHVDFVLQKMENRKSLLS